METQNGTKRDKMPESVLKDGENSRLHPDKPEIMVQVEGDLPLGGATLPPFPSDSEGKLSMALRIKNEGNTLVKAGLYKKAAHKYNLVFNFTRCLPGRDTKGVPGMDIMQFRENNSNLEVNMDLETRCRGLESITYCNLALCYLKMEDASKALKACQEALCIDATLWKAHSREAHVHMELRNNFDGALLAFDRALQYAPSDQQVVVIKQKDRCLALLKQAEKVAYKVVKQNLIHGMSGATKSDGN